MVVEIVVLVKEMLVLFKEFEEDVMFEVLLVIW